MTPAPRRALLAAALPVTLCACAGGGSTPAIHPSTNLLAAAGYSRVDDRSGALADSGLEIGAIDLRARTALGGRYPTCVGLDATLGASSTGTVYGARAYPFGLVLPYRGLGSGVGWLRACAGFGMSGVRGAIPFGWEFPGELSVDLPLGPVAFRVWGRAALVASSEARRDGTEATAGFADEYRAGFDLRFGRPGRVGGLILPGVAPVVGLTWGDVMGTYFSGVYIGLDATILR